MIVNIINCAHLLGENSDDVAQVHTVTLINGQKVSYFSHSHLYLVRYLSSYHLVLGECSIACWLSINIGFIHIG
jgi:hypothetical protein